MEINNGKEINLDQKSRIALIAAVVLLVLLIICIIVTKTTGLNQIKNSVDVELGTVTELTLNAKDFFDVEDDIEKKITFDVSKVDLTKVGEYKAYAVYDGKEYTIKVVLKDTTAPKVTFAQRYTFTNDAANPDLTGMFEGIQDASECTAKFIRFERKENLSTMDEKALKGLTEQINTRATDEELKNLGTADVPTEEGIYCAVLEVADEHGNTTYEEVVLILDKTGAKIEDVADKTITVTADKLSVEPAVDKSEYIITDNVDGKIAAENITTELELRDESKHEWLVHVSYVDRAGNESKADFLIIVKEGAVTIGTSGNGETTPGNGGSSNQEGNSNADNNAGSENKPTNNQDVSTWVPTDDENDISPYEQMVIDAGYGNVVEIDDGVYAVLMKDGEHTINGLDGGEILIQYLAERDLEATHIQGGWIDSANDWYWWTAENIRELVTPDEDEFWD